MPKSQLEQLREFSVIVVDTGEIESMQRFTPRDATTNPSHIANAAQLPRYQILLESELRQARHELGRLARAEDVANLAFQRLAITWGKKILEVVPGRVSTEVDARLSYDTEETKITARKIIRQYEAAGIDRSRILIKIAATWEGIRAAEVLEQEGIHCNLTLIFGLFQAVACAEAGVTLVSPFCGRVLDWYRQKYHREYVGAEDPGVISVTRIYNYFKKFGYKTEVMGASFWTPTQVAELVGCDLLTIAPKVLLQLEAAEEPIRRKLSTDTAEATPLERLVVDSKDAFETYLANDAMATDKLNEGIEGFTAALVGLEDQLVRRLRELETEG